jgi:hypothetical protein
MQIAEPPMRETFEDRPKSAKRQKNAPMVYRRGIQLSIANIFDISMIAAGDYFCAKLHSRLRSH